MEQTELIFKSTLTPQSQRLLDRLKMGPVTNADMRDDLRLLSYTRRLSDLREHGIKIKKEYVRNGVFQYSIEN